MSLEVSQNTTPVLAAMGRAIPLITSLAQLRAITQHKDFPFAISVLPGEFLICHYGYRLLPQKRLTVHATWRGKKVVAKLFYDSKRGETHFLRDLQGVLSLKANNIPTADVIHASHTSINCVFVTILHYLDNTMPLAQAWPMLREPQKQAILKNIINILAELHQAGCCHHDLHFGNFLLQDKKLFLIDGDSITENRKSRPCALKESLHNLALFCVELNAKERHRMGYLLRYYLLRRKIHTMTAKVERYFNRYYARLTKKRQKKMAKKVFRNCSVLRHQQHMRQRLIISRFADSPAFCQMLNAIDTIVDNADRLKSGNTCTLVRYAVEGQTYVIKRYNMKNWWHRICRCWRPTRASQSWRNAHLLQQAQIPTPTAVALKESRFGMLRGKAYFIYCYVNGVLLSDFLNEHPIFDTTIAQRVVRLFGYLFEAHITHGDLKASNILLCKEKPILLDLDSLTRHHNRYRFKCKWEKDMQRFLRNWDNTPHIKHVFETLLQQEGLVT